jgi:hypothetical protein
MSEYAQRFAENRIDFSILCELTDQDLKELGVVLGDRRKMLRAIADINAVEKNAPAAPERCVAYPSRQRQSQPQHYRRPGPRPRPAASAATLR